MGVRFEGKADKVDISGDGYSWTVKSSVRSIYEVSGVSVAGEGLEI